MTTTFIAVAAIAAIFGIVWLTRLVHRLSRASLAAGKAGSRLMCPKCGHKMGALALYCNTCGAKLPEQNDPDALAERGQRRHEAISEFDGGLCGEDHHNLLWALSVSEQKRTAYCPDCGKNLHQS